MSDEYHINICESILYADWKYESLSLIYIYWVNVRISVIHTLGNKDNKFDVSHIRVQGHNCIRNFKIKTLWLSGRHYGSWTTMEAYLMTKWMRGHMLTHDKGPYLFGPVHVGPHTYMYRTEKLDPAEPFKSTVSVAPLPRWVLQQRNIFTLVLNRK